METLTKTRKIGGSIVVTLPKTLVEEEGLHPDQAVIIKVKKIARWKIFQFYPIREMGKKNKHLFEIKEREFLELKEVFDLLEKKKIGKDAVFEVLVDVAKGKSIDEAASKFETSVASASA